MPKLPPANMGDQLDVRCPCGTPLEYDGVRPILADSMVVGSNESSEIVWHFCAQACKDAKIVELALLGFVLMEHEVYFDFYARIRRS